MLSFLNVLYTVAHLVLISFILTGWIWKRTRKLHFIVVILTALSWFVLGIWYGWGYCPLTDWHWDVKEKLGERNLPNSFVKYFADQVTGGNISSSLIDVITVACLILAAVASVYVNFLKKKNLKSEST